VETTEKFIVTPQSGGKRLDVFLRAQRPDLSRSFLQSLIERGFVRVNGKIAEKSGAKVRTGDEIFVKIPAPEPLEVEPEKNPLEILHEDDDLIVVNKTAGMVVHPAAGVARGTLVNALLAHCGKNLSGIGGVLRPGVVHRLDRDTSGCIVVAKTDAAHQNLSKQFAARTVKKVYQAVALGVFDRKFGKIETEIGRSLRDRKKMSTRTARGRVAVSEYRVLEQFRDAALVEVAPKTGRTHQIRVHLAHLGHAILGDRVYGKQKIGKISAPRQMLHAAKLGFSHPKSGKWLEFEANLPQDFAEVLEKLR
jgi:23S rRNA pseudouridine1911/1915/1917 synthase